MRKAFQLSMILGVLVFGLATVGQARSVPPCYQCQNTGGWDEWDCVNIPDGFGGTGCMSGSWGCAILGGSCEVIITKFDVGPSGRAMLPSGGADPVASVALDQLAMGIGGGMERTCNGVLLAQAYSEDERARIRTVSGDIRI